MQIEIADEIVKQLEEIAEKRNESVEMVVRWMVEKYLDELEFRIARRRGFKSPATRTKSTESGLVLMKWTASPDGKR